MSLWHIAWSYLWNRKITSVLTILSVALGVGLIFSVLSLREETRKRFEEEGQFFDIVVGGKGSPLQLVLSCVYFMDVPPGTISLEDFEKIRQHPDVEMAFPLAMGDTYRGYRIVGTSLDLFDYVWTNPISGIQKKLFTVAEGRVFQKPMELVVGSVVARSYDLKVGDTLVGTHGFTEVAGDGGHSHEKEPYTIVGILQPSGTPHDRALFTNTQSVWSVHGESGHAHSETEGEHHEENEGEHHDEEKDEAGEPDIADVANVASNKVTGALVLLTSPGLRPQFARFVNENYNAMAVVPINEIMRLYENVLGTAKTILLAVGYLVVIISAISILIGLYLSILQRRRDLAIMRALGATAYEIVGGVLIEALLVTTFGILAGYLLGNAVCYGIGLYLLERYGLAVSIFGWPTIEIWVAFATVAFVGVVAGLLPAWQAYGTNVARDLAEL